MTITNDHPVVQALLEIGNDRGKAEGIILGEKKKKNETLSIMKDLAKKGFTLEEATNYLANNT
ncbi:MAG: hypothetical protein FWG68_09950 [Defluviitaleaceae bacterium]|nr:hypothetical protein [Defluviitaleaceae bacterium]